MITVVWHGASVSPGDGVRVTRRDRLDFGAVCTVVRVIDGDTQTYVLCDGSGQGVRLAARTDFEVVRRAQRRLTS